MSDLSALSPDELMRQMGERGARGESIGAQCAEIRRRLNENAPLSEQVATLTKECQERFEQHQEAERLCNDLTDRLAAAVQRAERAEKERDEWKGKFHGASAAVFHKHNRAEQTEAKLASAESIMLTTGEALSRAQRELEQAEARIRELEAKLDEAQAARNGGDWEDFLHASQRADNAAAQVARLVDALRPFVAASKYAQGGAAAVGIYISTEAINAARTALAAMKETK